MGRAAPLPDFAGVFGRHAGARMLVLGCGASLSQLPRDLAGLTVGVNDCARHVAPTYLCVLNPRSQFPAERVRAIAEAPSAALFTHLDLGRTLAPQVRFRLGARKGLDWAVPGRLPYTRTSVYVALALALRMGAAEIGLLGVDFTDDHFFGPTGPHALTRRLDEIDAEFAALARAATAAGRTIVNLSAESRLTAFPRADLGPFLARLTPPDPEHLPMPHRSPQAQATRRVAKGGPLMAVHKRGGGPIGDLMDAVIETGEALGWRITRDITGHAARRDVVKVVWNGRRFGLRGPTIFCEHGWLPRSAYQLSPKGINAGSHAAPFHWDGKRLSPDDADTVAAHLAELREKADRDRGWQPGRDFLLVPLQMEGDTNLVRHAPPNLMRMQGLIDHVTRANPPLPVLFKQHPADAKRHDAQMALRTRRKQDSLVSRTKTDIDGLLNSGHCKGIVTVNSNTAHDGMIWGVPSVVLGRNTWPQDNAKGPFLTKLPRDWGQLFGLWDQRTRRDARDAYALHLIRTQWSLDDIRDTDRFGGLLRAAQQSGDPPAPRRGVFPGRAVPHPPRALAPARARSLPTVNVVAENRDWHFEALKAALAARNGRAARVVASAAPVAGADAFVFIRARELAGSPAPARSVVQIHDDLDEGQYRPGGPRAKVARAGAIVLSHPDQRAILARSGIALDERPHLVLPPGAPARFVLRQTRRGAFRLGWTGRPEPRGGDDLARLDWLVQVVTALPRPAEVVLIGDRLSGPVRALSKARVSHRWLRPVHLSDVREAEVFRDLDTMLLTHAAEPAPPALFKALASGVPVVAPPVGWARELLADGSTGLLGDTPKALAKAVGAIQSDPRLWLRRRSAIRDALGGRTLEGWCDAVIDLALGLVSNPPHGAPAPAKSQATEFSD